MRVPSSGSVLRLHAIFNPPLRTNPKPFFDAFCVHRAWGSKRLGSEGLLSATSGKSFGVLCVCVCACVRMCVLQNLRRRS